jgi:hypothetical protein
LLYRLECLDEATAAFGRTAALDPTNSDANGQIKAILSE